MKGGMVFQNQGAFGIHCDHFTLREFFFYPARYTANGTASTQTYENIVELIKSCREFDASAIIMSSIICRVSILVCPESVMLFTEQLNVFQATLDEASAGISFGGNNNIVREFTDELFADIVSDK